MMETIAVLFIFFMLLTFGLIFYANFQKSKMEEISDEGKDLELVTIVQTIRALPELKCSDQSSITENCFDLLSLTSLKNNLELGELFMKDGSYYRDYFTSFLFDANITLEVYDEKNNQMSTLPIYSNPYRDTNKNNVATNFVPITLLDSRTGEYHFGMLYIRVYY